MYGRREGDIKAGQDIAACTSKPAILSTAMEAQRMPQVAKALERLHRHVSELESVTEQLISKLQPISKQMAQPASPSDSKVPEAVVMIAGEIEAATQRVRSVVARLHDQLARTEV